MGVRYHDHGGTNRRLWAIFDELDAECHDTGANNSCDDSDDFHGGRTEFDGGFRGKEELEAVLTNLYKICGWRRQLTDSCM